VSAAAFACCEVELPAVGDGLPKVGWASTGEAARHNNASNWPGRNDFGFNMMHASL
jgi:hypothetical protein